MSSSTLSEVGQLEALKLQGNYDTGQMFLHKVGRGEELLVKVMVTMVAGVRLQGCHPLPLDGQGL